MINLHEQMLLDWFCEGNLHTVKLQWLNTGCGFVVFEVLRNSSNSSRKQHILGNFLIYHQILIVLGFNDTSTLEGHFVSSPREREKRDRRESRGDEREGQGRKRNRNESEETEEIKTFPLYPYPLHLYKDSRPCPTVSQYQLDAPVM